MQADSQMAVSLLCTRITNPDMDDRKKLTKITIYLQATWSPPLILHIDNFRNIQWCTDGTFTMHNNIKNNTGISMTMGKGPIYQSSQKQKLNSKRSTEAELIRVDNKMNQRVWTKHFLDAQEYLNIRSYFITEYMRQHQGFVIKYRPSGDMFNEYFMKRITGSQFRKIQELLLGIDNNMIIQYNREYQKYVKK